MREGGSVVPLVFFIAGLLFGGLSCEPSRRKAGFVVEERVGHRSAGGMSGCSICHADVEIKSARSKHIATGIGCTGCHGKSEGHIRDENNEVKPERVFAPAEINAFCRDCHECSLPPEKRPSPKICTDCHDAHALGIRAGR